MSRGDPGDIPLFGTPNLVEALSIARDMPSEALELAVERPDRIASAVLSVVERRAGGAAITERDANLLFWGTHVLAAARKTELCGPFLRLLALPGDELEEVLGPALDGTLSKIVIGTFDGDPIPLSRLVLAPGTDELVRHWLFQAAAYLTWSGRIGIAEMRDLLMRFDEVRPGRPGDLGWEGWEIAIAFLGLRDLAPAVAAARSDARLLDEGEAFEALLAVSEEAAPEDAARFVSLGVGPIDDIVGEMEALLADEDEDEEPDPIRPVVNPLRHVGRNDPCPCGSGKKHKACCLAA